jgi:carboxylesterase type B
VNTVPELNRTYQGFYDNITTTVGCNTATDSLACLRTIPFPQLYNASVGFQFKPIIDGTFISQPPSQSIQLGQIADVAVIMGSNTDEGTAEFFTPRGTLNNDSDVFNFVKGQGIGLDINTANTVLNLYPDDPVQGCPFGTGPRRFKSQGFQYKRGAAIAGDLAIHAGRRFYATDHAERSKKPIYTYRFNQAPWNMKEVDVTTTAPVYVTHFTEIVYVFDNPDENVNWIGPYPIYQHLQKFLSKAWISFIHDQNPNNHGLSGQPIWPEYSAKSPQNMVFQTGACYVEDDDYRMEQLAFWGTIWPELQT